MECSTGHLRFTALDYRAATYEKLGQLQGALRDAKGMIDGMPGMAKVGFLCFFCFWFPCCNELEYNDVGNVKGTGDEL